VASPQTVPVEPAQAVAVEPTSLAPAQATVPQATLAQPMAPLDTSQPVPAEPAIESPAVPPSPTTVWAKALDKLNTFKQRAVETERRAQFNRAWDSFRPPPSSDSSEQ
jgi:hypothetical protein